MDNFYKIYLEKTIDLVKSLLIKSDETATAINDHLVAAYGPSSVDYEDLTTWKYYLNISGLYHQVDDEMKILSLDTLNIITFNKRNLLEHNKTREEYKTGSLKYNELISKYPHQELLIKGILNPVDINKAIEAENDTILFYRSDLVEYQEETLIYDLQEFILRFKSRWDVKAHVLADEYYFSANYAILFLSLVPKVLNIRLSKCKTREAHTYHIREYLASHNKLDRFMPYLTLKQILFLYRNILHIERNAGKQTTFFWLIEKMLTDRFIPVHEFSQRHWGLEVDDKLPEIKFRKKALNRIYNTPEKTFFNLDEILEKELPVAVNNEVYSKDYFNEIENKFKLSPSSVVQTKVLESAYLDYEEFTEFNREYVYLTHWAYLSYKGYLNYIVEIKELDGTAKFLSTYDAYIYLVYIFNLSLGNKLVTIPDFEAYRVLKDIKPEKTEIYKHVTNNFKKYGLFEYMYSTVTVPTNVTSEFIAGNYFETVYNQIQKELKIISNFSHKDERAYASTVISSFYMDTKLENNSIVFSDWLMERGLKSEFKNDEYKHFIDELINNTTGLNRFRNRSISETHKALLQVLTQLSSYSIQFVGYTNPDPIKDAGFRMIRLGDLTNLTNYAKKSDFARLDVYNRNKIRTIRYEELRKMFIDSHSKIKNISLLDIVIDEVCDFTLYTTTFVKMSIVNSTTPINVIKNLFEVFYENNLSRLSFKERFSNIISPVSDTTYTQVNITNFFDQSLSNNLVGNINNKYSNGNDIYDNFEGEIVSSNKLDFKVTSKTDTTYNSLIKSVSQTPIYSTTTNEIEIVISASKVVETKSETLFILDKGFRTKEVSNNTKITTKIKQDKNYALNNNLSLNFMLIE